mmetsp:Transcript_12100/g.28927  ORF Transcript_12100/g.28927 Transcript_12100/m.28927 type:complete len:83 (+) Transcript_12100:459-707(+)
MHKQLFGYKLACVFLMHFTTQLPLAVFGSFSCQMRMATNTVKASLLTAVHLFFRQTTIGMAQWDYINIHESLNSDRYPESSR